MEKNTYLGTRVPQTIKTFSKYIPNISKNAFRLLVQLVVNTLENRPIADGALQKIQSQVGPVEHIEELFAGIYFLIRSFLWLPTGSVKQEVFQEDLRGLKLNEECIADLTSVLYGPKRSNLDKALTVNEPRFPHITRFDWRLNVIISSSCVSRVLEPSLLFELQLSNGEVHKFCVPISKFHLLRHTVAALLADMSALEKRSFFKKSIC